MAAQDIEYVERLPAEAVTEPGDYGGIRDRGMSRGGHGSGRRGSGAELAIRRRLVAEAPATTLEDALGVHLAACDWALRRAATGAA